MATKKTTKTAATTGIKVINGVTHITTAEALIAYLTRSNALIRVPPRKANPEELLYPVGPADGIPNHAVAVKTRVVNSIGVQAFRSEQVVIRDLTDTGVHTGEYLFARHQPLFGYGKQSHNYGLPKGMPVSKLKAGIKIKTRWNEGDCYAIILDRESVTKGRTFELHVLLDSGNVTYVSSDQVLELHGSAF